jgi:hypothetical protein
MAMPPSVQAFRRSFAGAQDSPSLGMKCLLLLVRNSLASAIWEPGVDVIHQLYQAIGVKDGAFASSAYNKLTGMVCPMQMPCSEHVSCGPPRVIDKISNNSVDRGSPLAYSRTQGKASDRLPCCEELDLITGLLGPAITFPSAFSATALAPQTVSYARARPEGAVVLTAASCA